LYSRQLGLVSRPLLVFTDEQLKKLELYDKDFKAKKNSLLGLSWKDSNVIYLNIDNTDFAWQIIDTLIHELLHLKYPKQRHSKKFQNMINEVIIS